ncbi:MAG: hypothetical protein ACC628_00475 [Pirellulaceae bacterium]
MGPTLRQLAKYDTSSSIADGLEQLLQSWQLAKEVDRDIWEFAVEKSSLNDVGVSNSDLRWMICQGLVEHAYEVKEHAGRSRQFRTGVELCLEDRSCFVLTSEGQRLAQEVVHQFGANRGKNGRMAAPAERQGSNHRRLETASGFRFHAVTQVSTPTWDGARHQLRVGSTIVKEFKLPSPNQETILAAFEEEGWPPRVDDPLPVHPELDPRRRLHDTIKSLNRNQRSREIRFMGDGTGEGVRWEWTGHDSNGDVTKNASSIAK